MSKEDKTWKVEVFSVSKFKERLKEKRKAKGMNQEELAKAIDVTQGSISSYEKGEKKPTADKLWALARTLGCTADYLLGGEEAKDHDSSFVCEQTGLSGETVEILREAVEKGSNKYKLLIDLFEFLLQHYISYEFDLSDNKGQKHISNDTYLIFDHIIDALGSMLSTQALIQFLPGGEESLFIDGEYSSDILEAEAEVFLSKHGKAVIPAKKARDYYLREAADKFKDVLLPFCMKMTEEDPNYVFIAGKQHFSKD